MHRRPMGPRLTAAFVALSVLLVLAGAAPVHAGTTAVAGPISLSVALNTDTCAGGPVTLIATVLDTSGTGVPGATVTGYVQYKTTGHGFPFPTTDTTGNTAAIINTGWPRGGYEVLFTVHAAARGYTADADTTCFAPWVPPWIDDTERTAPQVFQPPTSCHLVDVLVERDDTEHLEALYQHRMGAVSTR